MSPFAAPAFGLALLALGVALLRRHRRTWQQRKNDPDLDHADRTYYYRQYRRRLLTSGLLAVLGVLIPVGDLLIDRRIPLAAAILYWIGLLLLVLFVLLLGVVDFFVTGMHTKDALLRVHGEKAAIQRQLEELRRAYREGREPDLPSAPEPRKNGRIESHEAHGSPGRD